MLASLRQKIMLVLATFTLALPALGLTALQPVYAADSKDAACQGIGLTGADCGNPAADQKVGGVIKTVVTLLSWVVGIAAVIMIVISGFRYITSAGEASKVTAAKQGVIYAVVGLVIVALAQFIVRFVLSEVQ